MLRFGEAIGMVLGVYKEMYGLAGFPCPIRNYKMVRNEF